MIDFEQAREIVAQAEAEKLRGGSYIVAPWGHEDATRFHVVTGRKEVLIEGRFELAQMDAPIVFVDKRTGVVTKATYLMVMDELDAMTPCGALPPQHWQE